VTRERVQTEGDYFRRAGWAIAFWLVLTGGAAVLWTPLAYVVAGLGIVLGLRSLWRNLP